MNLFYDIVFSNLSSWTHIVEEETEQSDPFTNKYINIHAVLYTNEWYFLKCVASLARVNREITCWFWPERRIMQRTIYQCVVFFSFAFEEKRVCERVGEKERRWDCSFYFSVPLKNERSVLCEGISLFRNGFHGNQIFLYIHKGATVQSACVWFHAKLQTS